MSTNRTTHEIIIRDGLPRLRSSIDDPVRGLYEQGQLIYHETVLPQAIEEHLLVLIDVHDHALSDAVGKSWLARPS